MQVTNEICTTGRQPSFADHEHRYYFQRNSGEVELVTYPYTQEVITIWYNMEKTGWQMRNFTPDTLPKWAKEIL